MCITLDVGVRAWLSVGSTGLCCVPPNPLQGASARDMTGKVIGFWIPITCFVTIGLEHCIANMYM